MFVLFFISKKNITRPQLKKYRVVDRVFSVLRVSEFCYNIDI